MDSSPFYSFNASSRPFHQERKYSMASHSGFSTAGVPYLPSTSAAPSFTGTLGLVRDATARRSQGGTVLPSPEVLELKPDVVAGRDCVRIGEVVAQQWLAKGRVVLQETESRRDQKRLGLEGAALGDEGGSKRLWHS